MKLSFVILLVLVGYTLASRDFDTGRGSSGSRGSGSDTWGTGSRGSGSDTWGTGSRGSGSDTWGTGSRGSGSAGSSLRGSGGQCQWIRGHVKCADSNGKHDKNHVVVRLADGSVTTSSVLDEGYTSQNGQFAVFSCSGSSSFRTFQPELQVLHFCKSNRARKLRVPVPAGNVGGEYNITSVIDLKAYYPEEADYQDNIQLPCAA